MYSLNGSMICALTKILSEIITDLWKTFVVVVDKGSSKGGSSVLCLVAWTFSWVPVLKLLPHLLQRNGRSTLCHALCSCSLERV